MDVVAEFDSCSDYMGAPTTEGVEAGPAKRVFVGFKTNLPSGQIVKNCNRCPL